MIPVATRDQVRELDRLAIESLGIPGVALMESASRALAMGLLERFGVEARQGGVLLVCGGGNNGGDGFGAARWLHGEGIRVPIWALSERSSGDAAIHRAAYEALGLPLVDCAGAADLAKYGVLVDAIFGTGLSRAVAGPAREAIDGMNASGRPVVAADLPSGLDADTGAVHGSVVHADLTISFGAAKPGLYAGRGPAVSGAVRVATLGLSALREARRLGAVLQSADVAPWWPRRPAEAHKTRSGHLGVVAGSTAMAGAAVLCCRAALAAGAGLVTLVTPRGALTRLQGLPPEVMVYVAGEDDRVVPPAPHGALARPSAWVLGPGLGGGEALTPATRDWLVELWTQDERPIVADADALGALPTGTPAGPRVITPHPGEAARILGTDIAQVQRDRFEAVQALSGLGCTALLKGPYTLVASPGEPLHVNATGNAVLATAGSGDVLAGLIGALLSVQIPPHRAASLGAFVHGRAGDLLRSRRSTGWTASDIAEALPLAVENLEEAR